MKIRVYYEDTDAAGIVYYANYLRFAERARTELLRDLGYSHGQIANVAFAVRYCEADYKKPARLDDLLEVKTDLTQLGGASLEMRQSILREGEELVLLHLKLACITRDARPARIPAELREKLASLLEKKD